MGWTEDCQHGLDSWLQLVKNKDNYQMIQRKLKDLQTDLSDELTVMVAGEFKSGKSTFINALLGQEILTSDVTPATAVVTKLTFGEKNTVIAHFVNGDTKEYDQKWLELLTAERTGKFQFIREQLSFVELQLPIPLLKQFTIVDSPGLNSDFKHHTEATERFLKRADVAIWLFSVQNVATQTEIDMLKKLADYNIDTFGIINRIDMLDGDEDELEDIYESVDVRLKNQQIHLNNVIGVSSKEALHAKLTDDKQELKWSNWQEVDRLFDKLATEPYRKHDRFYQKLTETLALFDKELTKEKTALQLHKTLPLMISLQKDAFPKLTELKIDIANQNEELLEVKRHWESLLPERAPLNIEESIQITEKLLDEIPINTNMVQWDTNPHRTWHTLQPLLNEYNQNWSKMDKIQAVRDERKQLIEEWSTIQGKRFFKKRHLKKLQDFHVRYLDLNDQINELKTVSNQIQTLPTKMSQSYGKMQKEIKTFIDNDIKVHKDKVVEQKNTWDNALVDFKKDYKDIPSAVTERAAALFQLLDTFLKQVVPHLKVDAVAIRELDGYKNALHRIANIETLQVDYRFNTVHHVRIAFDQFKKHKSKNDQVKNFYLTPVHFSDKGIPSVPYQLHYNSASLIDDLQLNIRNQRVFALYAVGLLVIGYFVVQAFTGDNYTEGQATTNEEPSITSAAVAETDDVTEEEPEEEVPIDVSSIRVYLDELNRYVDILDYPDEFQYDNWFRRSDMYGTYPDFLDGLIGLDLSLFYIQDTEQMDDGNIYVETRQVYQDEFFKNEYLLHYTLAQTDGNKQYVIVDFTYQLVEQEQLEIQVDDDEIAQFMATFRTAYMNALNEGDFSYVSNHLEIDSPAYNELSTYVADIAGRNFYFDFESVDIASIQSTGVNTYLVTTNEIFRFFNQMDDETYYDRVKDYILHVDTSGELVINKITITDTVKEEVIERTVNMEDYPDFEGFFRTFYGDFVEAFNWEGFSYISSYYVPGGKEYEAMEAYIPSVIEKNMYLENKSLQIIDYSVYDDSHYLVTIDVEDNFFYQDQTGDTKKIRYQYLVKTADDGSLLIEESPSLEILEEQEFTWEES